MMFQHNLKSIVRSIVRYKTYSLINIIGLAVGLFLFIIILLFVKHEINFDCFHKKYKQIYRLEGRDWAVTPAPFTDLLLLKFPEIKKITRINFDNNPVLKYKNNISRFQSLALADSSLFSIFSFNLLSGNPNTALIAPFTIVLTQSTAFKLFKNRNPVGEKILWNNTFEFTVTGIIEDLPSNSSIQTSGFASLSSYPFLTGDTEILESFKNWNFFTYLLIEDYKPALLTKINLFIYNYINKQKTTGTLNEDEIKLKITPLESIYFDRNSALDVHKKGQIEFVYLDIYIAIFILLIAAVNFINISTARAHTRVKEVIVRKIVGASRKTLIVQFFSEFIILSIIALFFALILVEISLPVFNALLQINIKVQNLYEWRTILFFIGITIFIGVLSGLYPALVFSGFNTRFFSQNSASKYKVGSVLRKVLITFQFVISIILIVFTLTIHDQIKYVDQIQLGFDVDGLFYVPINTSLRNNFEAFKKEINTNKYIIASATSYGVPGSLYLQWSCEINGKVHKFHCLPADPNFVKTLNLSIVKGRNFDINKDLDVNRSFILNEAAVREFGLTRPIGTVFTGEPYGEVVGVVKDFHFKSAHFPIEPLALYCTKEEMNGFLNFRLKKGKETETIRFIEAVWNKFCPDSPMECMKLIDVYKKLYDNEKRLREIFTYFSILSIFIACLGLFGLATFIAQQRTKEIGVRKAIGASVFQIVLMLTKAYTIWVLLANLFAWPIAYFMVKYWLTNFINHVPITLYLFLYAGCFVFLTALSTVYYQAIIVASKKTVEALRYE